VTPKSAGIESPSDFEGKTLGGAQGTPTTRLFPVFAEINGIDLDKVAQESMAPNLQETYDDPRGYRRRIRVYLDKLVQPDCKTAKTRRTTTTGSTSKTTA